MDFGDILEQWESDPSRRKKPPQSAERANENVSQDNLKKINPMDAWMRRYGVVDKDSLTESDEKAIDRSAEKKRLKAMPPQASCDLHGLTRDEAWLKLDGFITECARKEVQKALIVHGKGNHSETEPVLAAMVRTFIEQDPRLGAYGHPIGKDGGNGATWVLFK
jgi:DNA-nicking Smr family endonuclease